MSLVTLQNVSKVYPVGEQEVRALDGVDLSIEAGAFTVVLGPSGSGKSTALNLLGGMDTPTSGRIDAAGTDLTALDDRGLTAYRRDKVGFVFQHYNLVPNLTAAENVGLGSQFARDAVAPADALASVGLGGREQSFPAELSGGQMQRVAIARALAKRPPLLLCDEPTGALDSETGRSVITLLRSIADGSGTAVVVVTHNAEIARIADHVITLHDGSVREDRRNESPASPEEIDW
ncbi:ABC transporter ATP-binding protein [Sanguibacter massiliensis]|uniref:ABC transporter ATP-binding protein n=1 Tax=Sanguibacter massiliensis TaxID=1973217 RepID=UPI000C85EBB0|nr:ABC transporter ATP-binding protein [Sanguibacter massiliensis]